MKKEYLREASDIVKDFLIYMQNVQEKSETTLNVYYVDLRMFFRFRRGDLRFWNRRDEPWNRKRKSSVTGMPAPSCFLTAWSQPTLKRKPGRYRPARQGAISAISSGRRPISPTIFR